MCDYSFSIKKPLVVVRIFLAAVLFVLSGCADKSAVIQAERHLVGAHYYSWYPGNWSKGCLRRILEPEQFPMLGYYDSWDINVVEQQIAWCSRYGVDFLTLDWWHGREEQTEYIRDVFLKARNIQDIDFCIFYETWSLGFDHDIGSTMFDDKVADKFVESILGLADEFFSHPSYLRVNGRPVIILYLTRTLAGDFQGAVKRLRRELAKKGHDVFIIGDEVFWKVTPVVKKNVVPHPLVTVPQEARIGCFDAITSYNMYENEIKSHAGYGSENSYIRDVAAKYDEYLAADKDVYFVPGVIPGYNDRAGRLASDHYVMPRRWSVDLAEGSFFEKVIDELALKYEDSRLNMFMITSWNEWNEDTAIEPMKSLGSTDRDRGDTGIDYTCGYKYAGYGMTYLEILRDKVVGIYGRATNSAGVPVAGLEVRARQGAVEVRAATDSDGYYRLSRLRLKPGECDVTVGNQVMKVTVQADKAVCAEGFE